MEDMGYGREWVGTHQPGDRRKDERAVGDNLKKGSHSEFRNTEKALRLCQHDGIAA